MKPGKFYKKALEIFKVGTEKLLVNIFFKEVKYFRGV